MSHTGIDLPADEMILTLENTSKAVPGFARQSRRQGGQGQFAKTLASAYIKFTVEGRSLADNDSVQSFIALSDLHRSLTEEAQNFLHDEMPLLSEDQPMQPLLLNFSLYRLSQAARHYHQSAIQKQHSDTLEILKTGLVFLQAEFDEILRAD